MISEPNVSISRLRSPAAWNGSSLRSELLHTSSARSPDLCAGVPLTGRISWRTTSEPRSASCQAHSEPARPPPMTWMGMGGLSGRRRRDANGEEEQVYAVTNSIKEGNHVRLDDPRRGDRDGVRLPVDQSDLFGPQ